MFIVQTMKSQEIEPFRKRKVYTPYKELNTDQELALEEILTIIKKKYSETTKSLNEKNKAPIVVKGMPGTGKTILLIYLLKLLKDKKINKKKYGTKFNKSTRG